MNEAVFLVVLLAPVALIVIIIAVTVAIIRVSPWFKRAKQNISKASFRELTYCRTSITRFENTSIAGNAGDLELEVLSRRERDNELMKLNSREETSNFDSATIGTMSTALCTPVTDSNFHTDIESNLRDELTRKKLKDVFYTAELEKIREAMEELSKITLNDRKKSPSATDTCDERKNSAPDLNPFSRYFIPETPPSSPLPPVDQITSQPILSRVTEELLLVHKTAEGNVPRIMEEVLLVHKAAEENIPRRNTCTDLENLKVVLEDLASIQFSRAAVPPSTVKADLCVSWNLPARRKSIAAYSPSQLSKYRRSTSQNRPTRLSLDTAPGSPKAIKTNLLRGSANQRQQKATKTFWY